MCESKWLNIETAPKGRNIWLGDVANIRVGCWQIDRWIDYVKHEQTNMGALHFKPTHWMDLPAAPDHQESKA